MTATGTCIQEMTYSDEYDGTYIIMDHTAFNLEHMFGDVYRIANDQLVAIFMLEDENKLTILNRIYNMFNGSIEENRAMFSLNKTTGVDTVNIYDYAGSSWRSSACVLNAYEKDGAAFTLVDAGMSSFDVSFLSTDIENKTLTLSTNAVVTTLDGTAPVENFSAVLSVESVVLNMENTGYNTWLGKSENGNLFTVTMLTDKMALITADIGYTRNDWYDVDILAVMQRVDPE